MQRVPIYSTPNFPYCSILHYYGTFFYPNEPINSDILLLLAEFQILFEFPELEPNVLFVPGYVILDPI